MENILIAGDHGPAAGGIKQYQDCRHEGYQNGGDMQSYNPYDYRCCQHNMAMAWPYMNDHLWMATRDNGIAAVLYAPSEVKAKVGKGTQVRITEATGYPFDETVTFTVSTPKPAPGIPGRWAARCAARTAR